LIIDEKEARERRVKLDRRIRRNKLILCIVLFVIFMVVGEISLDTLFWGVSARSLKRDALIYGSLSIFFVYVVPWIALLFRQFTQRGDEPGRFHQDP
jgi:hypothetical protein